MANFFTSPGDVADWIKREAATEDEAVTLVTNLPNVGTSELSSAQESIRRIFANSDVENSLNTLWRMLCKAGITNDQVQDVVSRAAQVKAAESLLSSKIITADKRDAMVKAAQIMRQPGEYPMPLRYCPKLPGSIGHRLISTYNCRHYCFDGIVLDDDPERVYCGETMWRRHVMDKFSTEWKDRKTGKYVGGYINDRFYVYQDDGGNPMELKPDERTRIPRPHQWSVERRLIEQREKGSGQDLTIGKTAKTGAAYVKTANVEIVDREEHMSASGYITKIVGGYEFELEWTLRLGHDSMDEIEIEWPEEAMNIKAENTPGQWSGTVYHPETGQVLIDGLARENLEAQWKDEIFDAIAQHGKTAVVVLPLSKTASVAARVLSQAGSFVKLASSDAKLDKNESKTQKMFSQAADMISEGKLAEDIVLEVSKSNSVSLAQAVKIHALVANKMTKHAAEAYEAEKVDEDIETTANEIGLTGEGSTSKKPAPVLGKKPAIRV